MANDMISGFTNCNAPCAQRELVMITLSTAVVRSPSALSAEADGQLLLMSVEQGRYYGFDDVSKDIWQRIELPVKVSDLCQALASDYCAGRSVIEQDVLELLGWLADEGLVDIAPQ